MVIKVLGSAAGGGYPQWNCNCPYCRRVRNGDGSVHARMNDAIAVSDDGGKWYLINATPDVSAQIESHPALHPGPGLRGTPISGVLLTDAELDHTLGLLHLRQSAELDIYAASPVLHALSGPFPVRQIIEPYASFRWTEVRAGESFPLFGGRLIVYPIQLGRKSPRYVYDANLGQEGAWVVGYRITDKITGGIVVYAPGIESWTAELEQQLKDADCIMLDGTFWHSAELRDLGASELEAADMGHIPITGADGTFGRLTNRSAQRRIYIHINNTNPILDTASSEYRTITEHGIEVGYDGLELEV
ncbi:pyrroloquinoline quinone biosynthesis protein PqqB [Paenibacillus piri]|uniref:Coenzyme PQQ synthesis protein B n=1 Tax=Paenibacillus piri TaxID=2547395 RepID=A0A4R5KXA4_9BACL|nr:pyrroloquinoline quinone biosynthesis protein PqqB [Paenibacillus piri]TDF99630.1 pyrroloquinoline quinone biosynthesis protein PqqB [Paenibacillus piri]